MLQDFLKFHYCLLLIAATFFYLPTFSQEQNTITNETDITFKSWNIGLNVSSYGPTFELSRAFSESFAIKASYSFFLYNLPLSNLSEELKGDTRIQIGGPSLLFEYYLFKHLYFVFGATFNQTNFILDGIKSESVFIGDIEMYPEELGKFKLELKPEYKVGPYFGIGIGRNAPFAKRVSTAFEVGFIYQGEPQVKMETTGMLKPTSSKEQIQIIEDNISMWKIWPVVSLRLAFRISGN